jgi:LytS/YehU family sensor histidine kinase
VVDNSKLALIPLKTELEALNLYLELESLRFEKKFEYKIDVAPNIDVNYTHIPSMIIQPYIENAIWHGLMHKKTQGKILIRIELNGDMLKCTIEDNGIGRKRSAELKPATSSHKSLGMALTKERLDILNQVNNTHLNVMIHDLYDQEGEAMGTRVELNIPLQ